MDASKCGRPDHNPALNVVECEGCGKRFAKARRRVRCRCGHLYARFVGYSRTVEW